MESEYFKKLEQTETLLIELYNGCEFTNEMSAGCIHDAIAAVQVEMMGLMKTTHKFTPGPWKVKYDQSAYHNHIIKAKGTPVAETLFPNIDVNEVAGNARLIAQAPRMYEILKKAVYFAENPEEDCKDAKEKRRIDAKSILSEIEGD